MAAAFAGGIWLRLWGTVARRIVSSVFLEIFVLVFLSALLPGFLPKSKKILRTRRDESWIASIELGVLAGCTALPPVPAEQVVNRVVADVIDLGSPLWWHGRLSSERAKTPWGDAVEMTSRGVEAGGEKQ